MTVYCSKPLTRTLCIVRLRASLRTCSVTRNGQVCRRAFHCGRNTPQSLLHSDSQAWTGVMHHQEARLTGLRLQGLSARCLPTSLSARPCSLTVTFIRCRNPAASFHVHVSSGCPRALSISFYLCSFSRFVFGVVLSATAIFRCLLLVISSPLRACSASRTRIS